MKNFKRISYIILIVIILILSLIIYFSASKNNDNEQDKKGVSEIRYVESKLVDLINSMNNIESRNYKISVSEVSKETSENSGETSSGSGSNSGGSSSSSGGDSSDGSGSQSDSGQSQGGSSQTSAGNESAENQDDNKKFELTPSGVLTNNEDINWDIIKSEVENMYSSIPTVTIDLYQLNLNQEDILNFNKEYDNLTVAVKNESKEETLSALSKLYDFMPKFIKNTSEEESYKKVLQTKADIFKAYSKLDAGDWGQIESDINNSIQTYSQLLSDTNVDESKQYNLSKGYIMLNELQNAVKLKDTEVFLIKYKNLIEELNSI